MLGPVTSITGGTPSKVIKIDTKMWIFSTTTGRLRLLLSIFWGSAFHHSAAVWGPHFYGPMFESVAQGFSQAKLEHYLQSHLLMRSPLLSTRSCKRSGNSLQRPSTSWWSSIKVSKGHCGNPRPPRLISQRFKNTTCTAKSGVGSCRNSLYYYKFKTG